MTNHSSSVDEFAKAFADEVFAEMSRNRQSIKNLAEVINVTPHTAGTRISGKVPFSVIEMAVVANWLGIELEVLVSRASNALTSKAAA